jgi:hypothetical protein
MWRDALSASQQQHWGAVLLVVGGLLLVALWGLVLVAALASPPMGVEGVVVGIVGAPILAAPLLLSGDWLYRRAHARAGIPVRRRAVALHGALIFAGLAGTAVAVLIVWALYVFRPH